ncbi:MAG: hypothetical protein U9N87_07335 [Planctomycetota bacterium]|nr:hypothetical protein [Planctomycetota bacterium]
MLMSKCRLSPPTQVGANREPQREEDLLRGGLQTGCPTGISVA